MAHLVTADRVKARNVEWLWRERVPRSMLTVVAGRPDQGKGMLAATIAADVSKEGGKVLYSAAEDSNGLMTRPRLEAAGAVLKNIILPEGTMQVPAQFAELAEIIIDEELDLVVIDPLAAHLSGNVSRHSDSIRTVLNPLTEVIEQTNTGVLIVEHVNKRVGAHSHPLSAIGGSGSGLPAACRMAYLFGIDPDDDEKRVLACVKSNLRDKPEAIFFETDEAPVRHVARGVPFLITDSEGTFDPIRLVAGSARQGKIGRPAEKRSAAAEWLAKYLHKAGKPVAWKVLGEDAKQHGMNSRTLRRAAADMKVVKVTANGETTWDLPLAIKELMGEGDEVKAKIGRAHV